MTTQSCDGCGLDVRIAGGIGDIWTREKTATGGITLELADGTEHFLCLDCLDRLPENRTVTDADVRALQPGP